MIDHLLDTVRRQLNISKTTDYEWMSETIYSAAGQMGLASLWDHNEENVTISIQHFKNRMEKLFDAFESLHPSMKSLFPQDKSVLLEEMYSIYRRSGFLYHSDYQLAPAALAAAGRGDLTLYRGISPDVKLYMSGLGFYAMQPDSTNRTVATMFGLQEQGFEDYLEELLADQYWNTIEWPENTEFLRLEPPFTGGYWLRSPQKDDRISLARYGEPNKIFVFYRYHDGVYQQKQIPEWRVRDVFSRENNRYGEYIRIAAALLKKCNNLPPIRVKTDGYRVKIKLGYRLPPTEEDFFKLYSWPIRYDFSSKDTQIFTRKMAKQVYPIFRQELERIGYCFVEE